MRSVGPSGVWLRGKISRRWWPLTGVLTKDSPSESGTDQQENAPHHIRIKEFPTVLRKSTHEFLNKKALAEKGLPVRLLY
jgi:hypothetical protein